MNISSCPVEHPVSGPVELRGTGVDAVTSTPDIGVPVDSDGSAGTPLNRSTLLPGSDSPCDPWSGRP